jgi:hypothetical protein
VCKAAAAVDIWLAVSSRWHHWRPRTLVSAGTEAHAAGPSTIARAGTGGVNFSCNDLMPLMPSSAGGLAGNVTKADGLHVHAAAAAQLMATKYFSRIRLLGARNAVLFGLFCMLTLNVRLSLRSGTQRQVSWWITSKGRSSAGAHNMRNQAGVRLKRTCQRHRGRCGVEVAR